MATLLNWITHSTGVTHLYYLIFRSFKTYEKERDKIEDNLQQYVKEYDLEVFSRVALSGDYNETVKSIIQTDTIGNLPLNTMLIDFDERLKMEDTINNAKALRKNVIVLRNRCGFSNFKRIDVWWRDHDENGNMMMLLAHLITHSTTWKKEEATIRLFKVVKSEKEYKEADEELSKNIEDARIDNLTYELIFDKKTPVKDLIVEKSQDTDLVILGLPKAGKDGKTTKGVVKEIKKHTDRLKMCMLVSSSEHIDLTIT